MSIKKMNLKYQRYQDARYQAAQDINQLFEQLNKLVEDGKATEDKVIKLIDKMRKEKIDVDDGVILKLASSGGHEFWVRDNPTCWSESLFVGHPLVYDDEARPSYAIPSKEIWFKSRTGRATQIVNLNKEAFELLIRNIPAASYSKLQQKCIYNAALNRDIDKVEILLKHYGAVADWDAYWALRALTNDGRNEATRYWPIVHRDALYALRDRRTDPVSLKIVKMILDKFEFVYDEERGEYTYPHVVYNEERREYIRPAIHKLTTL